MSKLPMKLQETCSTISVTKLKRILTVYLLAVNGSKICTKNFVSLYLGVCKADKIKRELGLALCMVYIKCIKNMLMALSFLDQFVLI